MHSKENQDTEKLIGLITKFTKINRKYFDEALKENSMTQIIKHPDILSLKRNDRIKYDEFIETANLYKKIKTVEELNKTQFASSEHAAEYLRTLSINNSDKENVYILMVDAKNRLIKDKIITHGSISHAHINSRDIVKEALKYDSFGLVLGHNHPSGDVRPSVSDMEMTQKLRTALDTVNLEFLDHIIFSDNNHFSFRSHNLIELNKCLETGVANLLGTLKDRCKNMNTPQKENSYRRK